MSCGASVCLAVIVSPQKRASQMYVCMLQVNCGERFRSLMDRMPESPGHNLLFCGKIDVGPEFGSLLA